ncbi:MAG: hypothetical protein LKE96_08545 [Acetobacter peroxydans]|nr:hypothetical protein [Acetobacter peroxydans]
MAFAILFVGIAVDFAIQFSVRFRAQNPSEPGAEGMFEALRMTGEETGHQILVAALATSAGFLAFYPDCLSGCGPAWPDCGRWHDRGICLHHDSVARPA